MIRLHLVVEGMTEVRFVNRLLAAYLGESNVFADARAVETSRKGGKIFWGGGKDYELYKNDLDRWMKEDNHPEVYFSTMIDLYALPHDFPHYEEAQKITNPFRKIRDLETAFREDISHPRFIPYLQLHEFEALLLPEPNRFIEVFPTHQNEINRIIKICSLGESPELINDDPEGAPSKRIIKELPDYQGQKASAGPQIALAIGLPFIRGKCAHFNEWLTKLENLDRASGGG